MTLYGMTNCTWRRRVGDKASETTSVMTTLAADEARTVVVSLALDAVR